jgi:hypothetical protein
MATAELCRDATKRLDPQNAWQLAQLMGDLRRGRLQQGDRQLLSLGNPKLEMHDVANRIEREAAEHQDGNAHADAENGRPALHRLAFNLAQDHSRDLIQQGTNPQALDEGRPVLQGRFGPHRLSGWQSDRPANRIDRAKSRGGKADGNRGQHDSRLERHAEAGEFVKLGIHPGQIAAEQISTHSAEQ